MNSTGNKCRYEANRPKVSEAVVMFLYEKGPRLAAPSGLRGRMLRRCRLDAVETHIFLSDDSPVAKLKCCLSH